MINIGGSIDLRKVLLESVFLLSSLLLHWAPSQLCRSFPSSISYFYHHHHHHQQQQQLQYFVRFSSSFQLFIISSTFCHHHYSVRFSIFNVISSLLLHFLQCRPFRLCISYMKYIFIKITIIIIIIIILSFRHHFTFPWSFQRHRHCNDYHHQFIFIVAALFAVQIFPIMHFNFPLTSASSSIITILSTFFSFRLHRHYCQDYYHHHFIFFVVALLAVQIFPIMHFIKLHFPFPGSFFIPPNEIKEFCDLG